jgi:hypothetical protein
MAAERPPIRILTAPIPPPELAGLVAAWFGDMVKYVADVRRGVIAIGGDLQADAEAMLFENGSAPDDLWGANYYPGVGPGRCIEYTSLINIRPARGNASMEIADQGIRDRVRELTFALVGRGETLP